MVDAKVSSFVACSYSWFLLTNPFVPLPTEKQEKNEAKASSFDVDDSSDDDEYNGEDDEEEDIDLQEFEAEDELAALAEEAEEQELFAAQLQAMSLSSKTPASAKKASCSFQDFGMDFHVPFQVFQYTEDSRDHVTVEFLTMTMAKDCFRPKVCANGLELQLGVVVPSFFASEDRLMVANAEDGFNMNTHKATSFEKIVKKIHDKYGWDESDEIIGNPQVVKLPFKCEEDIVDWEVQAFINSNDDLNSDLGGNQFFFILSVQLVSVVKSRKKKTKGGFRILGSPIRGADEDDDDEAM